MRQQALTSNHIFISSKPPRPAASCCPIFFKNLPKSPILPWKPHPVGLIFRGLSFFRVGKSIFSRHGGHNTKKVPQNRLHAPFRGTPMRARRVTHTPTRHQTLPWGSIGVAFKGFRTDGSHLVPAGTIPEHPPPPHRHDVARCRTMSDLEQTTNWSPEVKSCPWLDRPGRLVQFGSEKTILLIIRSDIYLILRCTSADSRQNIFFFKSA